MADLLSRYAEKVETFRPILDLPDPRETMPRSSTSVWAWMIKKANRSLGQEALPLCSHLALTSKMPLISLNMIFWPLIYLRVNILNPLPPLQSGTSWYSLVMRTKNPGPVFTKCLSQGLGLKFRHLSQVSAQNLLRLLS